MCKYLRRFYKMFKNLLRGSFLMSLMLIVCITLSGCDFDMSKIVSGIKNTLGSVVTGVGNFLQKGVEIGKTVLKGAKEIINPILDAGKEVFKNFDGTADKISKGLDKVDGVLDKGSEVAQKVVKAGEKLKQDGKDSTGNKASSSESSTEKVADPKKDSDTSTTTCSKSTSSSKNSSSSSKKSGNSSKNSSNSNCSNGSSSTSTSCSSTSTNPLSVLAQKIKDIFGDKAKVEVVKADGSTKTVSQSELMTDSEKKDVAKKVSTGIDQLNSGLSSVEELLTRTSNTTSAEKKLVQTKIGEIKSTLSEIEKDPCSKASQTKYEDAKKKLTALQNEVDKMSIQCGIVLGGLKSAKTGINNMLNALDTCFK